MSIYLKLLGVLIFVASLLGAIKIYGALDISTMSQSNQMLGALLSSPALVERTDQMRLWSSVYLVLLGLGIGSLCFGVGEVLRRR
jgi:hypothetical protein